MLTVGQQSLGVAAQESVIGICKMALDRRDPTKPAATPSGQWVILRLIS